MFVGSNILVVDKVLLCYEHTYRNRTKERGLFCNKENHSIMMED